MKNKGKEDIQLLPCYGRIVLFQVFEEEKKFFDMYIGILKGIAEQTDPKVTFEVKGNILRMEFSNENLAEKMRQAWK